MAIPATIPAALTALQTATLAAYPLAQASVATLGALQAQAAGLYTIIDAAVTSDDAAITAPAYTNSIAFAATLATLTATVQETGKLVALRALAGRIEANLANAGV